MSICLVATRQRGSRPKRQGRVRRGFGRICLAPLLIVQSALMGTAVASDASQWQDGLSLAEFVSFIQTNNAALKVAQNGLQMARETITEEEGIFQPILSMNTTARRSLQPLSVDDQTLGRTPDPYPSSNQSIEYGLSQLLSSGGTLKATTRLTREKTGDLEDYQLRGYLGVSLDQPLAQGFGEDVVRADIEIARIASDISERVKLDTENTVIAQAITVYLDALRTQLLIANLSERLAVLDALRQESEALIAQGRMAASTRLDIETAIGQVEALRLRSAQELARFKGDMLSFAGSRLAGAMHFELDADVMPTTTLEPCPIDQCVSRALENRADLKAQQLRIEQAGMTQVKAWDRLRGQMDLFVEVGFSEQARQVHKAFEFSELQGHPDALIGLEIRVPLGGDKAGLAALNRARMEESNARIETQDLQIQIENELEAQRLEVEQTAQTWSQWKAMEAAYQEQVAIAKTSVEQGRGDMISVLRAREAQLNARASMDEARITHAQAWVGLMAAQGIANQLGSVQRLGQ